jgi:NAD/NADP transhydrogenase beta subunit
VGNLKNAKAKTMMVFGDAKKVVEDMVKAIE